MGYEPEKTWSLTNVQNPGLKITKIGHGKLWTILPFANEEKLYCQLKRNSQLYEVSIRKARFKITLCEFCSTFRRGGVDWENVQ